MKNLKTLSALALLAGGLFISSPSYALSCSQIQNFGNALKSPLETKINQQVAGSSHRINRRKSLKVHKVYGTQFSGCNLNTKLKVTLKRKIRRDAHGNITLKATVSSVDLANKKVCLSNIRISNVSLSRTLGIGEWVYKKVANRAIKNNQCFTLR